MKLRWEGCFSFFRTRRPQGAQGPGLGGNRGPGSLGADGAGVRPTEGAVRSIKSQEMLTSKGVIFLSVIFLLPLLCFHFTWRRFEVLGASWAPMHVKVDGPCVTPLAHLFGAGVYMILTLFFFQLYTRRLCSLAINRILHRRLYRMMWMLSILLAMQLLLRSVCVADPELTLLGSVVRNGVFFGYFLAVVIVTNTAIGLLLVGPSIRQKAVPVVVAQETLPDFDDRTLSSDTTGNKAKKKRASNQPNPSGSASSDKMQTDVVTAQPSRLWEGKHADSAAKVSDLKGVKLNQVTKRNRCRDPSHQG
eukprot:CAMPEP_0184289976 /NCGR_PEP_ID=MMETSP1049-20130417/2335_1 /TAXON_ID=77928 /ORGANISM="Proteomonas sulcata, Strain CCMP704" /LENGTH=304 /DNA_ID=CAMNT_0026596985 /DNA_START=216 /DNA_END=1130 /DNA_ORIENTATION=-